MAGSSQAPRWPSPGPHRVATTAVARWSVADGRSVAVLARYPVPDDAGRPWPVIVFCHGLGGSERSYAALGAHLASHGYAVLHPRFLDSFNVVRAALGLKGVDERTWTQDERARDAMLPMLFDPWHWMSRLARARSVIDSLDGQRHLPVSLDPGQVIIAGHSYGAFTAQLLLGTRLHAAGPAGTGGVAHPAVAGGILLSPQGSGDRGLTSRSWDAVTRPLLVVTATKDLGPHGEGLAWRREPFDAAASRLKHLTVALGGTHHLGGVHLTRQEEGDLSGRPPSGTGTRNTGTRNTGMRDAVMAVSAAFADRVHADRAAGDWLASEPFPFFLAHEHQDHDDGEHPHHAPPNHAPPNHGHPNHGHGAQAS